MTRTKAAILDRLGIETSVANRITMSDALDPARFKWVFQIDSVLFPFDNSGLAARNPDEAAFMITFGSDAFPMDDRLGVEELYWFGVHKARTALAAALAEMIAAREITEPQALGFAHGYLHDNAAALSR